MTTINEWYIKHKRKILSADKFIIDWQIVRIKSKGVTVNEKYDLLLKYFNIDNDINKFYRILNYIKAYDVSTRNGDVFSEFIQSLFDNINYNSNDSHICDIKDYDKDILLKLYKDLTKRNDKWTSSGYVHVKQNNFLSKLSNHLGIKYVHKEVKQNNYKFLF